MVAENQVIGAGIVVLNILPFFLKKPQYLLLTAIVSLIMLFLLMRVV